MLTTQPSLLKRIRNNRLVHEQHYLNRIFFKFDAQQASHDHLKSIRDLLRQGAKGIQDRIISSCKDIHSFDSAESLSTEEKQILDILLSSFTLKHATNDIETMMTTDGKMKSLHHREATGEIITNRRTPRTQSDHYSIFLTLGIGSHQIPRTLVKAKHIVTVDLLRMEQEDPLSLNRLWVSGHLGEYKNENTYRTKLGNAKFTMSHYKTGKKIYDIQYENGMHLQWTRNYSDEVFAGADVVPGIALQFIYILRLLGGVQNPCVKKLYDSAHDKSACFVLLEKIMSCVMPGFVYPEAKIIGELDLSAAYVSIEKNTSYPSITPQELTKFKALASSIKEGSLMRLNTLLKKSYLSQTGYMTYHNELLLIALNIPNKNQRMEIIHMLLQNGLCAHGEGPIWFAGKHLSAEELDFLLSQEYPDFNEPLIKYIPNPNPKDPYEIYTDLIGYLRTDGFSADKLRILKKHGAVRYIQCSSQKLMNEATRDFFALERVPPQILNNDRNLKIRPEQIQKVEAMVTGVRRDGKPYVLLGRPRSSSNDKKDYYCFPGGFAKSGDTDLETAVIRELFEKTGIDVKKIPGVTIRLIQYFDDFNQKNHMTISVFLINVKNAPLTPYACDDQIEVKCVLVENLILDTGKPTTQYMRVGMQRVLGSNALLIEALVLKNQAVLDEQQSASIQTMQVIEVLGYDLMAEALKNNVEIKNRDKVEYFFSNMHSSQFEHLKINDLLADPADSRRKLISLILKYWPKDKLEAFDRDVFKTTMPLSNVQSMVSLAIRFIVHLHDRNEGEIKQINQSEDKFRKIFSSPLKPSSKEQPFQAVIMMALASAQFKINFNPVRDASVDSWNDEWHGVQRIIAILKQYKNMNHLLHKRFGLFMRDFSHVTDSGGKPAIRFITNNRPDLARLINHIGKKGQIYQRGESYFIQCGKQSLKKLGIDDVFVDYLLTFCKNSPFLMTIPDSSQIVDRLIKNQITELRSLDFNWVEDKPYVVYLTHVIQASVNILVISLSGVKTNEQFTLFQSMTASHDNVEIINIWDSYTDFKTMEPYFAEWIKSFPKLDKLIFGEIPIEDVLRWLELLSRIIDHSMLTVEMNGPAYLPHEYQLIADAVTQHAIQHELFFENASSISKQRINERLSLNQKAWILAKEHPVGTASNITATEKKVRNKLYYQSCATQEQIIISSPSNDLQHILTTSTSLKSVIMDGNIQYAESELILSALSESDAPIEYLHITNVCLGDLTIPHLIRVLNRHLIKQFVLDGVIFYEPYFKEEQGRDLAKAIAAHAGLEIFISNGFYYGESYLDEIIQSATLLFISEEAEITDRRREINAMYERNSQDTHHQLVTKNLKALSMFNRDSPVTSPASNDNAISYHS